MAYGWAIGLNDTIGSYRTSDTTTTVKYNSWKESSYFATTAHTHAFNTFYISTPEGAGTGSEILLNSLMTIIDDKIEALEGTGS